LKKNSQFRIDGHSSLFKEWYEDNTAQDVVLINEDLIPKKPIDENVYRPNILPSNYMNMVKSQSHEKEHKSSYSNSVEMPKLKDMKRSPSHFKNVGVTSINKININPPVVKTKHNSLFIEPAYKKSFDFSSVATDILSKRGNEINKNGFKSSLASKSQNKVKIVIKSKVK